jgi:hypothetical protein
MPSRARQTAVIAPKVMPLRANPKPGISTAPRTFLTRGLPVARMSVPRIGKIISRAASGKIPVASAIPAKPKAAKITVPTGAPTASAANIDIPTQAIVLPELALSRRPRPQLIAPVMTKLSAPPSRVRPTREQRRRHDRHADDLQRQEIQRAAKDGCNQAKRHCCLGAAPVRKAAPQKRDTSAAMNWPPATRPTTEGYLRSERLSA